jgi:hypothetical protein
MSCIFGVMGELLFEGPMIDFLVSITIWSFDFPFSLMKLIKNIDNIAFWIYFSLQYIYSVVCNMPFQLQCHIEYCSDLEHQHHYSLQQNSTWNSQTTWRTTIHLMWLQFEFPSHQLIQLKRQKIFLENLSRCLWIYCGKYSHRYVYQLSQQG